MTVSVARSLGWAVIVWAGTAVLASAHQTECPEGGPADIDIGADIEAAIGFPILHDDTVAADMISDPICKGRFCLVHNSETKTPVWVAEKMTRAIACGDNKRPSGWAEEEGVEPRAENEDYTHSKYARGHNAASDDFKSTLDWMKATFTFANAVPQIQNGFNGSYWRYLEEDVKDLALHGHEVYVVTGPIPVAVDGQPIELPPAGQSCRHTVTIAGSGDLRQPSICGGTRDGGPTQDCPAGVEVPAGMFKIIYLAGSNRMFAYAAANIDHRPFAKEFRHHDDYLETWRVSVRAIEELTNLEFFPALDTRQKDMDKNGCITTPQH